METSTAYHAHPYILSTTILSDQLACFVTAASYDNKISCWDISHYVGGCGGGSILARIHQISSFSDMVLCMQVC